VRFPSESHGFFVLVQSGEQPNLQPPIILALSRQMLTRHTSPGGAAVLLPGPTQADPCRVCESIAGREG
jgi:hypothetical protein